MKKILYISVLFLGASTCLFAQEGFGTSSPDPSSVVDMVANDKGVLLPRVALTEITDATTVPSPADYLTVMNTATAGTGTDAVSPGYYYWLNNQWNAVSASSQEPWNIQATADDATTNTQDIYQQGKVAIGFDENDAVSTRQLEVKGDFFTEGLETNGFYSGIISNDAVSGTSMNAIYTSDYSLKNILDASANRTRLSMLYTLEGVVGGQVVVPNGEAAMEVGFSGQEPQMRLSAVYDPAGPDMEEYSINGYNGYLEMKTQHMGNYAKSIHIDATEGISFKNGGQETYRFPQIRGNANQVLTTNGATVNSVAQLSWENVGDLVKAAMPKFFYMPAIIFDASTNGTYSKDLHAEYLAQFGGTGNPNLVSSTGANPNGIPTLPANELEYHITYYDTDVFANLSINANGVLTYDIIGNATEASYMNIVFVIK